MRDYLRLQTVPTHGPKKPTEFFIHEMVMDRRGEVFAMDTNHGMLVSKAWSDDWRTISTAYWIITSRAHAAVLQPESRRTPVLESLKGEFGRLITLYTHHVARFSELGPTTQAKIAEFAANMNTYENAIAQALNDNNLAPLRELAQNPALEPFANLFEEIAAIPDRGHRTTEERTRLLGKYTYEAHRKGQSWLTTGDQVIAKLTPLVGLYTWVRGDIAELEQAIQDHDPEQVKEKLKYAFKQHRLKQRRTRG